MIAPTGDKTVPFKIMHTSFFEKYVCLVNESNSIPSGCQIKSSLKIFLDSRRLYPKLSTADRV